MIPIPPQVMKYGAIVLAVLAVFGFGYFKGSGAVQAKFDTYKTEVAAAAEAQAREAAKVDAKNLKLFKDAQNAYNTSLANLRTYYGMRYNKGGGALPQVSDATGGANDYSPDNLPPATVLAGQCAETTLTLVLLQNFIRGAMNNAE